MYGPLTSKSNKIHEQFSMGPIQGETIILELTVPKILQNKVKLQINGIIHGYRDLFKTQLGYNNSGNCLDFNDVECFENPDWDNESDAVVRLINGIYYGSGALVNNTANDYTPYLLTAFHNIDVNGSGDISTTEEQAVGNCLFQFHYKSPTCNGSNSLYIQFTGGDLAASLYDTDFALIELDDSPVGNENITYVGWDNRNNTPTDGTVIHHPSGDVMKISLSNTSPNIVGNFWEYQFYSGITEGGSSGGPVLNQNNRVVGQLLETYAGDPISCSNQDGLTLYGRFDISWDGGGTNITQLEHWLDPSDTGNPTTNLLRSPSLTVPDIICYSGTTVSMQDPPSGVTVTWGGTNVAYPYGNTGTSVTVRAESSSTSDEGTVTASFTVNGIQRTITHPVWVGKPDPSDFYLAAVDNYGSPIGPNGGPFQVCPNNYYTFYFYPNYNLPESHHRYGINDIDFYFDFDYDIVTGGYGWAYIVVRNIDGNSYGLVDVDAECGFLSEFKVVNVNEGYCGYLLSITPNPTTNETTLAIESVSEEKAFDDTVDWELEVYSETQLLKTKQTGLRGRSAKIQTAGWQEGIYLVRVNYKDEIVTGKLLVKR